MISVPFDRLNFQLDQTIINKNLVSRFHVFIKCLICDGNFFVITFKITDSKYKLVS